MEIQSVTMRRAEETKLENPPPWILCNTEGEPIRETTNLIEGGVYYLRSSIRVDKEGITS
jgi:hypothetical protein